MRGSKEIPSGGGEEGGGGVLKMFLLSTCFTEGRTDLPREAIGPSGQIAS